MSADLRGRAPDRIQTDAAKTQAAKNQAAKTRAANTPTSRLNPPGKRMFDLAVAIPLAVLTFPVVIVLAVGSAVVYRAWPLFTQLRVGWGGHEFTCVKVRSLPAHAPVAADRRTIDQHENNRWGQWLRNSHLDELPQLWLVLAGTMSLVGPRPVIPGHCETFEAEFVAERVMVRPGLTGLWQIGPHKDTAIGEHPEFDLYYLEHRTARLDGWIMLRTAKFLLGGQNNLPLERIPRWTGAAGRRRRQVTV